MNLKKMNMNFDFMKLLKLKINTIFVSRFAFFTNSVFTILILIKVFTLVFLVNCQRFGSTKDKMIFTYNESSNITSLDPAFSRSLSNIWAVNQIFNGLVQFDNDLEIKPAIAHNWSISDDGKVYTFYLRTDVYFHEDESIKQGRKVVASDFVYSFNRILDPKVASPGTWIFQNVKKNKNNIPYFIALNDTTFQIVLDKVFPPFLGLLAMQYCSVVPKEAVEFYGTRFRQNPIGTGPFKFAYWKENVKLVLLKNENYFEFDTNGVRLPYLDAINVTFIVDKQTAFMDFLKGNIDIISGIDASYKDALLDKRGNLKPQFHDKIFLQTEPFLNTEYLGFQLNTQRDGFKHQALNDVRVRKAINYSFDRRKMLKYLRNNKGIPGEYGFVPPFMPGFSSSKNYGYNYNPQLAAQLLADAGFPNGKGLEEIELTTTNNYLDVCKFIQHEAAKLGIRIKIDVMPSATLRDMNSKGKIPFFRASWIADYPDAENYLSLFYSKNFSPDGPNFTNFNNEIYDKLFEKAISTTDKNLRSEMYSKLDSIAMSHSPVIIMYYDQVVRFIRKEVRGLESNPLNLLNLKYTYKVDL